MRFDIGSKKRFLEFINGIGKDDKVLLVSHIDLDGLVSAKLAYETIKPHDVRFLNYEELNDDLIEYTKKIGANKVVFTDLYVKQEFIENLEKHAEILVVDHHLVSKDMNSTKTIYIKGEEGYSAGYLCYELLSEIKNMEKFDWLVACCCISDYCHEKPANWLSKVFEKYDDVFEIEGRYVRKSGKIWALQKMLSMAIIYHKDKNDLNHVLSSFGEEFGSIGDLEKSALKVEEEIEKTLARYIENRRAFSGGYFFEFNPKFTIGSIISTIVSGRDEDKIIIIVRPDPKLDYYHVSIRRQDKKQNVADFLKNLVEGFHDSDAGGHAAAAGGHFPKKYLEEFKRRLGLKA